jgi:hypothetical protein
LYIEKTKKWLIKSFKSDPDADPRNLILDGDSTLLHIKEFLEKNKGETNES